MSDGGGVFVMVWLSPGQSVMEEGPVLHRM
jgi:hypothetical protein